MDRFFNFILRFCFTSFYFKVLIDLLISPRVFVYYVWQGVDVEHISNTNHPGMLIGKKLYFSHSLIIN